MRKICLVLSAAAAAWVCRAEPVCVDGVCYPDAESARAAGAFGGSGERGFSDLRNLLQAVDAPAAPAEKSPAAADSARRRVAFGYMGPDAFTAFLDGKPTVADELGKASALTAFLLVLLGGLLMNLTPCVLPLLPVSLALVGRGARRGAAYGLGMTLAYGALGLAAAFGGLAFGAIQSSPWFNLAVAATFVVLGLAAGEVFFIDFSRFRPRPKAGGADAKRGLSGPFLLGAGTAVLAGACVAPILLGTLVLTAKWFAAGRAWAVALPFALGAGMGLPWPFVTAGLSVLPKPGAWMRWVNRAFAALLFGMAAWYGWLAWDGFASRGAPSAAADAAGVSDPARPRRGIVGAPGCQNCTAMEKTTLRDPSVAAALARFDVTRVEINAFADLAAHPELDGLDIAGVPAYVVIEPASKEETK